MRDKVELGKVAELLCLKAGDCPKTHHNTHKNRSAKPLCPRKMHSRSY